jgi:membrane protease YdiL (CAAX protease family)
MTADGATSLEPEITAQPPLAARRPYLIWGTALWLAAALLVWVVAQAAMMFFWMLNGLGGLNPNSIMTDPFAIASMIVVSTPLALSVLVMAVRLRRYPLVDYFAWRGFGWKQFGLGFALVMGVLIASEGFAVLMGRDQPDFMTDMLSAVRGEGAWLLLLSGVIIAPLGEELIFRGFVYRGLSESRVGVPGAIVISSAIWAAIHTQYDLFYMSVIFALGVALAFVRYKSGSVALVFVLHALVNAAAFAQAFLPDAAGY